MIGHKIKTAYITANREGLFRCGAIEAECDVCYICLMAVRYTATPQERFCTREFMWRDNFIWAQSVDRFL